MSHRGQQADAGEVPAVEGGKPVRERMLPYGRHEVSEADIQSVVEVLRGDWLTNGPTVARFEGAFAEVVGARFAVAFSSGTAALHAAAHAGGIGPGLCPAAEAAFERLITLPLFPGMTDGDVADVITAVAKVIR